MSLELSGTTPAIKGVAGSVSAPALTGDDADTGISFPSANTIKFSTNGVERMSITNSGVSGITAGITEADTWFLTSSFNGDVDPISNNLSRLTLHGVNYLGTGMSVSSGVWTFPSTGFWRITVKFRSTRASGTQSQWQRIFIKSTVNNSAYNPIAIADSNYFDNYSASARNVSGSASIIFDCTNTSTHKIKFATGVQDNSGNSNQFIGSSSEAITTFEFIKLADT